MGMSNLMDGLFEQMNRVRELIQEYKKLPGNAGMIGAMLMQQDINAAENSIKENDVVKMLVTYEKLKTCE